MSNPTLQPPFIANFFLGLPRRVDELIASYRDEDGNMTQTEQDAVAQLTVAITDQLDTVLRATMKLGYPPATDLEGIEVSQPSPIDTSALEAGSLQLGHHVASTPITAWAEHPNELEELRTTVDQIAEVLRVRK